MQMNGQQLLTARLAQWAQAEGVTMNWVRGSLRFEDADGTSGTVASFPPDFWERFQAANEEQRERALDSIRLSVALQYRPVCAPYAHVIDVPTSYFEEFD
ncbi:hypothetical protein WKI45_25340 [Delftia tsuruhatensis]